MAAKKATAKRKKSGDRELIDTGTNKLFVRRNERGTSFKKVVDAGRSIAADKRQKAKRKVPSGAIGVIEPDAMVSRGFELTAEENAARQLWARGLSMPKG
jgi:hypothetical protein